MANVYKFTNGIVVYTKEQAEEYQKAGMILVKDNKDEKLEKEIKNEKIEYKFEQKERRPSIRTVR